MILTKKIIYGDHKKMPKKNENKHKQINVRLSEATYNNWEIYAENNGFSNISSLVRYCTNEFVEGRMTRNLKENSDTSKDKRISEIYEELGKIKESQLETLKIIAQRPIETQKNDKDSIKLRAYQQQMILNLLQEKPRNEEELDALFDDLKEVEIMKILNGLIEVKAIELRKDGKFKVI